MPDGLRIFQALTGISEPLRLTDLVDHLGGLGLTAPTPVGPVYSFMAAPMFHGASWWATSSWATRRTGGSSRRRTRRPW